MAGTWREAGTRAGAGVVGDEVEALLEGLCKPQKTVSSKYFYDERGSELFEEITGLPEYYLTRTERRLLSSSAPQIVAKQAPSSLIELGAGSAKKTRILLDLLTLDGREATYVPVDVSADFLRETAEQLRGEYPTLQVRPEVADLTLPLVLTDDIPRPALFALLGSTIGNFAAPQAARLLGHVRGLMRREDFLLLGADQRPGAGKSRAELEAAYNDSGGVTAEFNLNLLRVLNDRFGLDFDPSRFRHRAFYDETHGRIEMHLESLRAQDVNVPGGPTIRFIEGETLRTEISCKYDRKVIEGLFREAGLHLEQWVPDEGGRYALALAARDTS